MEENKELLPQKLNLPPQQVTKPTVQALFNSELVRRNYRKIIQDLQAAEPTPNNLQELYEKVKMAEALVRDMEGYRKEVSDPYFKAQKDIKATFDEIIAPISSEISSLKAAIKTVNDELLADLARADKERKRVEGIQNAITDFINNATRYISEATEDTQIVNIQKRIGSEKSRSAFYQEFIDSFREKCDALTPLINERKEKIRLAKQLNEDKARALESDDIERAVEITDQLESLDMSMEINVMQIQEKAFQQATDVQTVVAEPIGLALKGRNLWKWRVDDIKLLHKKQPELVELVPNKEAIDKILSDNKKDWNDGGKSEIKMNGLVFFIQKNL